MVNTQCPTKTLEALPSNACPRTGGWNVHKPVSVQLVWYTWADILVWHDVISLVTSLRPPPSVLCTKSDCNAKIAGGKGSVPVTVWDL